MAEDPAVRQLDEEAITKEIDRGLEKVNEHGWWIWGMFLLASSTGTFNAYHIMVANFIAFVPPYWCQVPELQQADWTRDQIWAVSNPNSQEEANCSVIGWNYTQLAALGYDEALQFVASHPHPPEVPCSHFVFDEVVPYSSTVSEWGLVCDRKLDKSNVQGTMSFGKLVGAFLFGFIADRFGRKTTIIIACVMYMVFGPLAAFATSFWVFIILRFFIGVAGSGCYETGFTLMAELVTKERRTKLGCMYNLSYPLGYMTLPVLALAFKSWRNLQLAISVPMLILLVHCWILPESPKWLITQGHNQRAWDIIKRVDKDFEPRLTGRESQEEVSATSSLFSKIIGSSRKVSVLFETEICQRALILYYGWFVAALIYYVLALNAANFEINQYLYTFVSGAVEVPAYISPMLFFIWIGRKPTSAIMYFVGGLSLISIAFIPKENSMAILAVAMLGRFTDVAVFGIIVLYTSELFPTTLRNTAIGSSLAVSQLGSIYAPYMVDYLNVYGWYIPSTVCGFLALACAWLILLLPETRGRALMDTVDQLKQAPKGDRVSVLNCCHFS